MQAHQEIAHSGDHRYRLRSPHLKHPETYSNLVQLVREEMRRASETTQLTRMLDVGAGDGAFAEPVLANGWEVTATEMSQDAISALNYNFGVNAKFTAVYQDSDGDTLPFDSRFSMVLLASVVHHIPDYTSALRAIIDKHLVPGGSLVTLQDPLWYPGQPWHTLLLSKIAYYSWRLFQGNLTVGFKTLSRRLRGIYSETNPSDMVEYHVVRKGVHQEELARVLSQHFNQVEVRPYWSTQSRIWQKIGERLGTKNVFALVARGYSGTSLP